MLLELTELMEKVTVATGDQFFTPRSEQVVYQAECPKGKVEFIDSNGTLVLTIDKRKLDLSETQFYKSYKSGSYLGRFVASCSRGAEFNYAFYGVELGSNGPVATVNGRIALSFDLRLVSDGTISRQDINLTDFNARRLERMEKK